MVRINKIHLFLILLPLTTHNKQKKEWKETSSYSKNTSMHVSSIHYLQALCLHKHARAHTLYCTQASLAPLQRWRDCGTAYNLAKGSKKLRVNSEPILSITKHTVPQKEEFHYDSQNCYKNLKSKCRRYFSSKGYFSSCCHTPKKILKLRKKGGLPCTRVDREYTCQRRRQGFYPWSRKITNGTGN